MDSGYRTILVMDSTEITVGEHEQSAYNGQFPLPEGVLAYRSAKLRSQTSRLEDYTAVAQGKSMLIAQNFLD